MEKLLDDILPVSVEHNCILSANGDITVVFKALYPEGLTRSNEEYEALNQGRIKAIRSLPNHSVFVQQDVFRKKVFRADIVAVKSFLSKASDRFYAGRVYFEHSCYISITLSPSNRKPASSAFCSLLQRSIVPEQTINANSLQVWETQVSQFKRLLQEAGIQLQRLNDDELSSTNDKAGWIEQYLFQLPCKDALLIKDISFDGKVKVGGDLCQFFTLSDAESFPALCSARITHDAYSTDKTSFPVGYSSYAGMLLFADHIYNQFIVLGDVNETRQRLERKNKRLYSLAKYSRENALSHQAGNEYLNEMLTDSKRPCRVHYNVMTIASSEDEAKEQVNQTMAAFAQMDAVAKYETVSAPQLYWTGIPGNAADIPKDHTIETFVEQASCFLNSDSPYISAADGIRFGERLTGRPVYVDMFDEPMQKGIVTNRNLFVCGGSGGGKSMTMNHVLRSLYDQGTHCVTVDIGGSYKGLCTLVNGYYFTYSEAEPIQFNPFYIPAGEVLDTEKKESLKALLVSLWKKEDESFVRSEYVALSNVLQGYYEHVAKQNVFPSFNSFYEYLETEYVTVLKEHKVKDKDFDIDNFLYVLRPYYKGGEFDYLLNATKNLDLLQERFIVFELDNVKDHPILFPVVTLIIMELFISKMRKLKGQRKILVIEEAWKAIAKSGMAEFIKYVFKTVRKFNGIAAVVTQEIDDLISSPIIKEAIINNADIKILMDMRKFMNKFDALQATLGLSDKGKTILLSVNRANEPGKKYREVFIDLGGQVMKVYRNELSPEEYFTYSTEEKEKVKVMEYAEKYGSMELGITMLVNDLKKQS
ncbi:TraG family conjugative transposon ATPase [Parafilimonas sp.]|uniref:TraG family conjugative transposon ATPase n=1 Tax=Parafilimonas sp. TaxID=1969739 RepID=UPI003F7FDA89